MDSVEVQEFLLSATATNDSILAETDKIFDRTDASTSSSLYFSINDDTMSNRLVDDLQQMERTLCDLAEEEDESHKSDEMSSVIRNNNNTDLDLLTTKDEEFFQQNLPLKPFPNHPMRSQCSTPKLEAPAPPHKSIDSDLVLPLTTLLQKIEEKKKKVVTIVEAENKENIQQDIPETQRPAKKVTIANVRKSLMKPSGPSKEPVVPAMKRPNLRKSMIPNAPATTATTTTIPKATTTETKPTTRPSLMASRRSVRMSVVPTTFKSARFTIGGGRSGKLNSPSTIKKSPKSKKLGTVTKSTGTSRLTISAATAATSAAAEEKKKQPKVDEEKAKKRMSRIPPPHSQAPLGGSGAEPGPSTAPTMSHPRPVFSCTVCKKSFHLKSTLTMHQKIHANSSASGGPSHFKCTYCDKDFEKEVGLRNHVERYCTKVPVAEKRKLNGSHNRTRTTSAEIKDRSKRDKSGSSSSSSKMESTTGSSASCTEQPSTSLLFGGPAAQLGGVSVTAVAAALKKEIGAPPTHAPASGLSPRKAIKSISQPHSGIKFSANKPIKCFQCRITFQKYVDFHTHVEQEHPQPVASPVGKEGVVVVAEVGEEEKGGQK